MLTAAQQQLAVAHLPLARSLAAITLRRVPSWIERDDVFAEAYRGLCEAAARYDPCRGDAEFASFAHLRIVGAISDHLRRLDHVSRKVRTAYNKTGAVPDGMSGDEFKTVGSLNVSQYVDEDGQPVERQDMLRSTGSTADEVEQRDLLRRGLAALPARERDCVIRAALEVPGAVIAADHGISESRVSQLRARGLSLARKELAA